RRQKLYTPSPGWLRFLLRLTVALVVMGLGLWLLQYWLPFNWHSSGLAKVGQLSILIVTGIILYFGSLFALGFRVRDFRRAEAE
ncbi:hypothetical protein SASC598O11_004060, partial [Snodgrassella alvi SCGC AB-598-O11]